ncbi:MAG: EF-hand domain-containing protein [Thiohalocapsa sp.]
MRWTFVAICAAIVAGLWLPGQAAHPAEPTHAAAAPETITFEEYRDWRNNFIERRRDELAIQLEAGNLPAVQKARLERIKAYYDGFATLPAAERDGHFHQRFDRIDTNHDGKIDAAERAAWREKRRALYGSNRRPAATASVRAGGN